jgi:GAF domain-containing protein
MSTDVSSADELAGVFARVAGLVLPERTVGSGLDLLVSLALQTTPAALGAGVTASNAEGRCVTVAGSTQAVERVDQAQYDLDDGPCLTAWRESRRVLVDDVSTDDRWPRWGRLALDAGVRSSLSVPMVAGERALGAVKLYAPTPSAFGDRDEELMRLIAAQAALFMAGLEQYRQAGEVTETLRNALRRRDVINQAKGIIMVQEATTEQAAFATLVRRAERDDKSVHEIAARVVGRVGHLR